MTPKYYNLNGTHIAMIGKSGSSAIGKAVLLSIKPYYTVRSASGDQTTVDSVSNGPGVWQSAPKTDAPETPIIPVREPVERFRSACAQDSVTDVDALLDRIEAGERVADSLHFRPTSDWLTTNSRLYKFPEHILDIASDLGVAEIPLINDNESNNIPKPVLTAEQLLRVEAIYADDITLYNSIETADQEFIAPPAPVPLAPVPFSITAWQAKAALDMTPGPEAGTTMLAAAEAVIMAMADGPEKTVVLSAWNNNANFERQSPTIITFGTTLGMTPDDLDSLFRLGASLTV